MNTLESQLFDWTDWDELGTGVLQFTDIILNRDIGLFKKGAKFECAIFDMQESTLTLVAEDNTEFTYTLGIYIV